MSWVSFHMPIFDRHNESKQTFVWDVRYFYDNSALFLFEYLLGIHVRTYISIFKISKPIKMANHILMVQKMHQKSLSFYVKIWPSFHWMKIHSHLSIGFQKFILHESHFNSLGHFITKVLLRNYFWIRLEDSNIIVGICLACSY